MLDLKADDQNRKGRRAGHQTPCQAKQHDLTGRDVPVGEALLDVQGVGVFVRVKIFLRRQLVGMVIVRIFTERDRVRVGVIPIGHARGGLKQVRPNFPVAGPDGGTLRLTGAVGMVIGLTMRMAAGGLHVLTRSPKHPQGKAADDDRRHQLEVRFARLGVPLASKFQRERRQGPNDERVRDRRRNPQQHGLPNGSADRHDERGHHRLGMSRLQTMQRA